VGSLQSSPCFTLGQGVDLKLGKESLNIKTIGTEMYLNRNLIVILRLVHPYFVSFLITQLLDTTCDKVCQ
jgi:hypothetical protein